MRRRDVALVLGLAALVIATRLPFATRELWAHDSVLYARALEQGFHVGFTLGEQRPHAPGYILYVALAKLFQMLVGSSNGGLVAVSIVASGVGAAAVFVVARRFAGRLAALVAAAGYAFNPLVWTYGEVAYPYTVLGALSAALAAWFWYAREAARVASVLLASLALGLLAGFRQDLLLLLGPLWIWAVWPRAWRERALAALAVGAGALLWFVPSAALSGGLGDYLAAVAQQSGSVRDEYSVSGRGLGALAYNVAFTVYALAWGLLGFGVVLAGFAVQRARRVARAGGRLAARDRVFPIRGERAFFLLWIGPALVFYVLVHIGEWGYILSVLPGLYALAAVLMERLVAPYGRVVRASWAAAATVLVALPALVFVASDQRFSAAALAQHDRSLEARIAYVRGRFAPDRTIILAREDYLLVRYYLSEYRAWQYDPQPHQSATAKRKRAMRATAIVVFTDGLAPRTLEVRYVEVAPNIHLAYVPIEPGAVLELYGDRYTVREPQ